MNTDNETIVSAEMMDKLREADLAEGYALVPRDLQKQAARELAGRRIVSMSEGFKRRLRNRNKRMRRAGVPGY